jgi:hypothetical protein
MDLDDLLPAVRHLTVLPHIRDLAIAYAPAFPIGWNREREDHSAGLRTFPLEAVAACGFIQGTEQPAAGQPEAGAQGWPGHGCNLPARPGEGRRRQVANGRNRVAPAASLG